MIYIFLALAVAFCLYVSLGPKLKNMNEGMWEITIETKMPETEMPISEKLSQCLTKVDPVPEISLPEYECRISSKRIGIQIFGNHVLWKVYCEGQGAMNGNGHIRYRGETLKGRIQMRTNEENQKRFNIRITGYRTGDCK